MEDFAAGFIRRLGSLVIATGATEVAGMLASSNPAAATVEMGSTEDCILELKYFRLSHTRTLKESYRFNVWQSQTFLGPTPPDSRVNGHTGGCPRKRRTILRDETRGQGPPGRSHHSPRAGIGERGFLEQDMGYQV